MAAPQAEVSTRLMRILRCALSKGELEVRRDSARRGVELLSRDINVVYGLTPEGYPDMRPTLARVADQDAAQSDKG